MKLFDYFKSKNKLISENRKMRRFIEEVSYWPNCGHPDGRLCDCREEVSMEITLDCYTEDAAKLLKEIK